MIKFYNQKKKEMLSIQYYFQQMLYKKSMIKIKIDIYNNNLSYNLYALQ